MLGLGLGLNKGSYIKPLPKWLTDAGCTFAINVDRQVKALANPNSPFINPLVDVVGKLGKNLFDQFSVKDGYYIDGSGNILPLVGAFADEKYYLYTERVTMSSAITGTHRLAWYDENKVFISRNTSSATSFSPTPPANAKYFRISADIAQKPTTQLEPGTVATTYEPYGFNNVLLQSFAGTTADGYTQIALPNGKNPWFLKFDGTDSLGIMANTADVDILGTNDFAISLILRTHSSLTGSYVFSKGDGASLNQQYAITTEADGRMLLILTGGLAFAVVPVGGLVANTLNRVLIYRKSGILTCYLNGVLSYQSANAISITTKPNPRIGARATDATGTAHTTFTNINLGNLAIFYNGATGLDIAKVEKAVAKLNANYI